MDNIRDILKKSKTLVGPFPTFKNEEVSETPYELFLEWFQLALNHGVHEPHSMTLSTTDHNGFPDARILILKDVDKYGWYFASSSLSEKGRQIEFNPNVALTFYWSLVGRQVRIRGQVIKMDKDISAKDFLARGAVARAIALLGKQSSILKEKRELDEALVEQLYKLEQNPNIIYPSWTLYRVNANEVEFWKADEERKHIRLKYTQDGEKWIKRLLWS